METAIAWQWVGWLRVQDELVVNFVPSDVFMFCVVFVVFRDVAISCGCVELSLGTLRGLFVGVMTPTPKEIEKLEIVCGMRYWYSLRVALLWLVRCGCLVLICSCVVLILFVS